MDVIHCNIHTCPQTDGGWSVWSRWTGCSATCNTGLRTRQRHCNNPKPSNGGQDCDGSAMDVVLCNQLQCPRTHDMIAFTADLSHNLENLRTGTIVVFDHTICNIGNTYDTNTGVFTCPQSGLYLFSLFVESASQNQAMLALKMNGNVHLFSNGKDDSGGNMVMLYVVEGSRVWVETTFDQQSLYGAITTFTGVLIHPDN